MESEFDFEEALNKLSRYCAYQDRCEFELRQKMGRMGYPKEEWSALLSELSRLGFWQEERFVRSFTRGKFRQKGWGKFKIRQALAQKRVDLHLVELALAEEIEPEEYKERLHRELEKKMRVPPREMSLDAKQKLRQALLTKGFEGDLINEVWKEVFG